MLTKTELKILKLFASSLGRKFSINEISKSLGISYTLAYNSTSRMLQFGLISKDEKKFLSAKLDKNYADFAYAEAERSRDFLKKNSVVAVFLSDILSRLGQEYFTLLVFGSSVSKEKYNDIDLLLIVPTEVDVLPAEKISMNIADNFSTEFHINVISVESVNEMLGKRKEANVMNETLNNHIVLFGAENYYRMVSNVR